MARARDPRTPEIAKRLVEARTRVFESAAAAGRALGLNAATVRAHESGQNGVGMHDLERYARRYAVDVGWLLSGRGQQGPNPSIFQEAGDWLEIAGVLQDGVWLPDPPERWEYARTIPHAPSGEAESVVYNDPRFPAEMIRAFKLVQSKKAPEYDGESVVFAAPAHDIGFRENDHVIVYLERGDFTQATLRRVVKGADGNEFHAITSNDPVITSDLLYRSGGDIDGVVSGVVIGSQVRRAVNLPTLEALRSPANLPEDASS